MSNTTINNQQFKTTGIDQHKLHAFARELAKDIHTQDDISDLFASLVKMSIDHCKINQNLSHS